MHQVAKVLEFQLQHQSSNEYSGLIAFRMDWFDLLAVQGDSFWGDPTLHILFSYHKEEKYSISFKNKLAPIQITILKCTNKVHVIKSSSGSGG